MDKTEKAFWSGAYQDTPSARPSVKLCRRSASTSKMTLARDCESWASATAAVVEGKEAVVAREEEEEDGAGDAFLRLFERDEAGAAEGAEEAGACVV
jgi:hypothetical protein